VTDYGSLSLWFDQLSTAPVAGAPLPGDRSVDVAIVGGGFTGLWAAYYLLKRDPQLKLAVIESETVGFGASGRNGGWCSALYPVTLATLAAEHGRAAAIAQYKAMQETIYEVARVAHDEGIDADIAMGGSVYVARSPQQLQRAKDEVDEYSEFGIDLDLLDADTASHRLNASEVIGGTYTPHCAAIQPAKLVRGLADVVRGLGAAIHEQTRVLAIQPGYVRTTQGVLKADVVIRATEGYTTTLPGHRRALLPVYSLIIATEPLSDAVWDEIGLRERETWADLRNLIIYGQRTADNRMVFGGRGAPYHFGSRIKPGYDHVPRVFGALQQTLHELFPVLGGTRITHQWGGALGIARDWHASVGLDPTTGMAWAGGYVGDGVSTTNLAGRTLADLITGQQTELTTLPWVGHRSRNWEFEPVRWLGANAGLHAMSWADRAESRSGRRSRLAGLVNTVMGR
jgi:glycine/D-amino acid oxidase-like deaminating enzyme